MKWNTILSWAIPIVIMTILVMVTDRPNDHVEAVSTRDPNFYRVLREQDGNISC